MSESLCTPETNTTIKQLYFNKINFFRKEKPFFLRSFRSSSF